MKNFLFSLGFIAAALLAQTQVDSGSQVRGSSSSVVFVDSEVPAGTINGINTIFTLSAAPSPSSSLHLYRNGLRQSSIVDFSLSGLTITFTTPAMLQVGDTILADYRK